MKRLDSGFRRNDKNRAKKTFYEIIIFDHLLFIPSFRPPINVLRILTYHYSYHLLPLTATNYSLIIFSITHHSIIVWTLKSKSLLPLFTKREEFPSLEKRG
ncbi:MAG: hypothetical protein A2Z51_11995 [Deltaproteobacteria bacterium RBG_19FT_COMBO_52_11]|nr:MAG: hypothetical protein A2Z51_11995 [Deltaproteobacteria bacterium RBG_19FT_COMBO_52_11]